jgi:pimeloyl-ACP methyl ester carboxylesterase
MILEKEIIINGSKVGYRECGEGFPLVLVHGMGGPLVWEKVIQPLSKIARVIAIDLPGFGKGDKPEINYTVNYYTDFLNSFIQQLNLTKFNLAGLSLGGWIASNYIFKYPENVERLILISSAGLKPILPGFRFPVIYDIVKVYMRYFIFNRPESLKKFQNEAFFDKKKVTQEIFDKFNEYINSPGARRVYFSALKNVFKIDPEFRENLKKINLPALIIWGENDPTFPVKYAKEFNSRIQNSKLELIPECGHTVTIEQPQRFCELMIDFLK